MENPLFILIVGLTTSIILFFLLKSQAGFVRKNAAWLIFVRLLSTYVLFGFITVNPFSFLSPTMKYIMNIALIILFVVFNFIAEQWAKKHNKHDTVRQVAR